MALQVVIDIELTLARRFYRIHFYSISKATSPSLLSHCPRIGARGDFAAMIFAILTIE